MQQTQAIDAALSENERVILRKSGPPWTQEAGAVSFRKDKRWLCAPHRLRARKVVIFRVTGEKSGARAFWL